MADASIRTFDLEFLGGTKKVAIGHKLPTHWHLVTVDSTDEYEPREFMNLTVIAQANPQPTPSSSGNHVFSLKNYSENAGVLEKLEANGIIKRTGVVYPQGYVQIPLVEVLLPPSQWISNCAKCDAWENLGEPRFQRCSKCKKTFYCSGQCQQDHWKEHKLICGLLAKGDYVGALNRQRAEVNNYLKDMGFQSIGV
ncbi:hypothetical protein PQX77_005807 [Marasmius sp. AFHP31]|nr:hypothetical protein PQX77_005807 [Marasmius sp. AFHP31]